MRVKQKHQKYQKPFLILGLAVTLTALNGCTLNEGDPQTTLCQKLTAHLMNASGVQWGGVSKVPGADKSMNVTVRWESQDASGTIPMQAGCTYLSNEDDAGEDYDMNTGAEYQSVPNRMVINGQAVRQQDLYTAIHKVTGQAIKETASEEHLRKKAAEAEQAVREGAAVVKEKAGVAAQAIKEGSEQFKQKAGEVLQKAGEHLQKK
ncbi:MAG: hypothetical protein V3U84_07420 [Thiotrichaceae bacterium]